ncbi:MAG: hypothetical protein V1921_01095 [Candidatus Altiarchaeota archaeon]
MESKTARALLILAILSTSIILSIRLYGAYDSLGVNRRIYHCLDFIEDGALYGGQPYCAQPPVTYFLAYFLLKSFGEDVIPMFFIILNTVVNAILFLILHRVIMRETGYDNYPLILLFYLAWVYVMSINSPDAMLSTFFLFLGFYTLFHSNIKAKHLLSGIFFSVSVMSKLISAPQVFVILLYYLLRSKAVRLSVNRLGIGFSYDVNGLKGLIKIVFPVALSFTALLIAYPHFLDYVFLSQLKQGPLYPHHDVRDTLRFLVPFDDKGLRSNVFTSEIALALSLIVFLRRRDMYSLCSIIGVSIFLYRQTWALGEISLSYFGLPSYTFFMVVLFWAKSKIKRESLVNVIFTIILAFLLLGHGFPTVNEYRLGYYDAHRHGLQELVEEPLELIPRQDNVLTELNPSRGVLPIDMPVGRRTQLWDEYYDGWWAPILVNWGLVGDLRLWRPDTENLTPRERRIIREIDDKKYDLIVYGPQNWYRMIHLLNNVEKSAIRDYCSVHLPNLDYFTYGGRHHTTLKFRNQSDCDYMLKLVGAYYSQNFEEICRRDKNVANDVINTVLGMNGITPSAKCLSGGNLVHSYNFYLNRFPPQDILVLVSITLLIVLLYYPRLRRSGVFDERVKHFVYFEAVAVLLTIFLIGVYYGQSPLSKPWYNANPLLEEIKPMVSSKPLIKFDDFVYGVRKDEEEGTPKVSELKWEYFYMPLSLNTTSNEVFFNGYFDLQDPDVIVTAKDCVTELYVNEMLVSENPECTACRDCSGFQLNLRNYTKPGWNLIAGKITKQGDEVFFHVEAN